MTTRQDDPAEQADRKATAQAEPKTDARVSPEADAEEPLPPFSVQVAQQLGGIRGLIESSVPVTAFVLLNLIGSQTGWWSLRISLIISVGAALSLAGYRLSRKESIRNAINGVFGIALGALIAWRSGEARDFYLPGILISAGYGTLMVVSVVARRPLVGWIWSVALDGGSDRWYKHPRLLSAFGWLTAAWAVVNIAKAGLQWGLYLADQADWLGVVRLALGWPPYALLLLATAWTVRRITRSDPTEPTEPSESAGPTVEATPTRPAHPE